MEAMCTVERSMTGHLVPSLGAHTTIPHRTRTHAHLKQESAFAARRLHVHNDSMVHEGEVTIVGYDHVQVAIPSGAEPVARDYYGGLLGMIELPKPAVLAARGGCWFTAGAAVLHLGVEADFRAASVAGLGNSTI